MVSRARVSVRLVVGQAGWGCNVEDRAVGQPIETAGRVGMEIARILYYIYISEFQNEMAGC